MAIHGFCIVLYCIAYRVMVYKFYLLSI